MFEAAGVSHDALSIASNEAPASARRNALERTAEQHPNDNFQEKDIPSCRTTFSFVSRRNAIRLSITNGQQIPREEFDTLLEILRLTPTSVNAQALHYFTATSQEARERLLSAFPEFNRDRITGASDVVVFTVPKTLTEAHLRRVLDKEESDGRFPNAEVKNAQDQGRRYFAGLHQGSEAELVAWEARQAYIGMGFLLFAAAGMGIDSTALEGVDFPKLNEILGLDEKNLTAIAAVSLGYRSPKDGNAQRPKSRLTRDELFTSLD